MPNILAAPLIRPIQFGSLIAQLTAVEITSFINNVNREILIDALSCYFIHAARASNKERMEHNDIFNGAVSSIIESRNHQEAIPMLLQLDALPSGLIGACGSYLEQRSYARLSTTNRYIYLGCNTPSTLKEVTVRYLSPAVYQIFNCSTISNARTLRFKSGYGRDKEPYMSIDGMRIVASQIAKMSHLQSLDLCKMNSEFIKKIANHKTTNQSVSSLAVYLCKQNGQAGRERVISSISAFKHIQYLRVHGLLQDARFDDFIIKGLTEECSDLKGLDLRDHEYGHGTDIKISVLRAVGHRLHYLRINIHDSDQIASLKNINFANLRELQNGKVHIHREIGISSSIQAILKTAINLEKVSFHNNPGLIVETLTKCKRLKYLELQRIEDMGVILDALERGLFRTNTLLRDTLKIRITMLRPYIAGLCSRIPISKQPECVAKLDRIVNSLSANKVDQWMIILDLNGDRQEFIKSLLGTLSTDIAATHLFQNVDFDTVSITNPGCTICGWSESWLMGSA